MSTAESNVEPRPGAAAHRTGSADDLGGTTVGNPPTADEGVSVVPAPGIAPEDAVIGVSDAEALVDPLAGESIAPKSLSSADRFMRRLLRLPEGKTSTAAEARSAFQRSLAYTTCRCLLMYIILPFVLPAVGIAQDVGPWIAIPVGVLAMVSIVYSIRRFWRADHSKRWHYTVFGTVIIGFLVYMTIADTVDLLA